MSDETAAAQKHPSRATDHLLGKMWKTKSARFNAQQRLMSRYWTSTVSTSVLACYLIAASILQLTIEAAATGDLGKIITSAILITSVFLLMITLTESAKNYPGEAERMHRSALEIAELYNSFQALDLTTADAQRTAYNDRYSAALKSIEVNHKDIDFLRFKIGARKDFKPSALEFAGMLLLYVALWLFEYGLYILIVGGPLVFFLVLIGRSGAWIS
jgi:hypothetical protein